MFIACIAIKLLSSILIAFGLSNLLELKHENIHMHWIVDAMVSKFG
jgi:hypothetical protein